MFGLIGRRPRSSHLVIDETITSEEEEEVRAYAVPLEKVVVKASIYDFNSHVQLFQHYINKESFPLEVEYTFPLPAEVAVMGFQAQFPDQTIHGVVKEKTLAKSEFTAAVTKGKQAALLEQDNNDVFTCRLGNLAPGATCVVMLSTLTELKASREGACSQFVLPTVVAPPYVRDQMTMTAFGVPPRPSPPSATAPREEEANLSYRLSLQLEIEMPSPLVAVTCSTHSVMVDKVSPSKWLVELKESELNKDLVIDIEQSVKHQSRTFVEVLPDSSSIALQTTFSEAALSLEDVLTTGLTGELVFLVDTSGSMGGDAMRNTIQCLQVFLRSLPDGVVFNVVRFNDRFASVFLAPEVYSASSLTRASAFVNELVAEGGTELLAALRAILEAPRKEGMTRQVFLLTDGSVDDADECIALAAANAAHTRIFTFGVGDSVSRPLVDGIARASGGNAAFVLDTSKISEIVSGQLSRALQPAITSVNVDWSTACSLPFSSSSSSVPTVVTVKQCPKQMRAIYPGNRYFVYGLLDGGAPQTIKAEAAFEVKVEVKLSNGTSRVIRIPATAGANARVGNVLHKLAARARIKELEDEAKFGDKEKEEVLLLAVKHQLNSRLTSFVAVGDDASKDLGVMAERKKLVVPLAAVGGAATSSSSYASGWKSLRTASSSIGTKGTMKKKCWSSLSDSEEEEDENGVLDVEEDEDTESSLVEKKTGRSKFAKARASNRNVPSPSVAFDPYSTLIELQQLDGSWKLDGTLIRCFSPHAALGIPWIQKQWQAYFAQWTQTVTPLLKPGTRALELLRSGLQLASLESKVLEAKHPQHELILVHGPYDKPGITVQCDVCGLTCPSAKDTMYHCESCEWDCHPECLTAPSSLNMEWLSGNRVMGTVLALSLLEKRFADKRGAWSILHTKGILFLLKQFALETVGITRAQVETLISLAVVA